MGYRSLGLDVESWQGLQLDRFQNILLHDRRSLQDIVVVGLLGGSNMDGPKVRLWYIREGWDTPMAFLVYNFRMSLFPIWWLSQLLQSQNRMLQPPHVGTVGSIPGLL